MNSLEAQLRAITSALDTLDRPYALVGGLAVSTRTEPRFTRDTDLAVVVSDDQDAERLLIDLRGFGYRLETLVEQVAVSRLATARLTNDAAPALVTDLLFASSGIEPEVVATAEPLQVLPDLEIPVASVGHLLAMKLLARDDHERPLDAEDLRTLKNVARSHDWEVAAAAVGQITARGFARGRDLPAALSALRGVDSR